MFMPVNSLAFTALQSSDTSNLYTDGNSQLTQLTEVKSMLAKQASLQLGDCVTLRYILTGLLVILVLKNRLGLHIRESVT